MSRWELPFYGLTLKPEDRIRTHTQIHELCYYGGGGFTLGDLYNLPIFLRYFHYNQLAKTKEKEAKAAKGGEEAKSTKTPPKKIQPKPF